MIKKYNIDAVAFIPPSVQRNVQIMNEFEKSLNFGLRKIKLQKISNDIIVAFTPVGSYKGSEVISEI